MKRYNGAETFSEFNPVRFYAGKIQNFVVELQPIGYKSDLYRWKLCDSTILNSYDGHNGLKKIRNFCFS